MNLIDLDDDTINADVLGSIGVTTDNLRFNSRTFSPSALLELVVAMLH